MAKDLTQAQVAAIADEGNHRIAANLYLRVYGASKTYSFRYSEFGKERWRSIGPATIVTLKEAKATASEWKADKFHGRQVGAPKADARTFAMVAADALPGLTARLIPASKRQWERTILEEAAPSFGNKPIAKITIADVKKFLAPLWMERPVKADRVKARLARVFEYAKVHGWRTGDNPADSKALTALLGPLKRETESFPAMPFAEVPAFFKELCDTPRQPALALRFLILTAVRTGNILTADWRQLAGAELWRIEAKLMKSRQEHVIPLSSPALLVLQGLEQRQSGKVFDKINEQSMLELLRRKLGRPELTVHGFRSSFADWAVSEDFPDRLIEACLAHNDANKVRASYRRDLQLEKRRELFWRWGCFVTGKDWRAEMAKEPLTAYVVKGVS